MKSFAEISEDLAPDGALRDFYILETTAKDWDAFLQFVAGFGGAVSFEVDGQASPLPKSFEEGFKLRQEASVCLYVSIAKGGLACHFFTDQEIELDFRPNLFQSGPEWLELAAFLQGMVNAVGKPGIVTHENDQAGVIEVFEPVKNLGS